MSDWLLNLPVLWMAVVILSGVYLVATGIYLLVTALAVNERARAFEAISPGILPPLSIIFALLVGFLAAQVWNDGDRAHGAVNREASALRGVVILASSFPGDIEKRLRELGSSDQLYLEKIINYEVNPVAEGKYIIGLFEKIIQTTIPDIADKVMAQRDQRYRHDPGYRRRFRRWHGEQIRAHQRGSTIGRERRGVLDNRQFGGI